MRRLRALWTDLGGVATVELALVAPLIAGLAMLSLQVWWASQRTEDVRGALGAAATYYMTGGADDAKAQAIAISAWEDAPNGGAVQISRACSCGATAQACSVLICADGSQPSISVNLHASGVFADGVFNQTVSADRVVRVR